MFPPSIEPTTTSFSSKVQQQPSRSPSSENASRSPKFLSPARRSKSFDDSPINSPIETSPNHHSLSPKRRPSTRTHERRSAARKSSEIRLEGGLDDADRVFTNVIKRTMSSESIHRCFPPVDPPLRQSRFEDMTPKGFDEVRMGSPRRPERRGSVSRFDLAPVRDHSSISPRRPERQASILDLPSSPQKQQRRNSLSATVEYPQSPVKRSAPRTQSAIYSPSSMSPSVSSPKEQPMEISTGPVEHRRSFDRMSRPTTKARDANRLSTDIEVSPKKASRKPVDITFDSAVSTKPQPMDDLYPKTTKESAVKSSPRRQSLLKRCASSVTAGKSAGRNATEARDSRQQQRMLNFYRKASQEPSVSAIKIKTVPSLFPKRFSLTAINVSDASLLYSPRKERPREKPPSPTPVEAVRSPVDFTPPKEGGAMRHRRRHSMDCFREECAPLTPHKRSPPDEKVHRRRSSHWSTPVSSAGVESSQSFGSVTASSTDVSEDGFVIQELKPVNLHPTLNGDSMACLYHQSIRFPTEESTVGTNLTMKNSDLGDSLLIGGNDSLYLYGKG